MRYFALLMFLFTPLFAINFDHRADTQSRSYEQRKQKRVDVYDFSGPFPNLENIDIDARRKKCVELNLTGEYPSLGSVNYEGSFGQLTGRLTGHFPLLDHVNFFCTSCAMNFDFSGEWEKDCEINIYGMKENVILTLPKNIGVIVYTKTAVRGKVVAEDLQKKGWGVLRKTYTNALADSEDAVKLTINIETTDGNIILN